MNYPVLARLTGAVVLMCAAGVALADCATAAQPAAAASDAAKTVAAAGAAEVAKHAAGADGTAAAQPAAAAGADAAKPAAAAGGDDAALIAKGKEIFLKGTTPACVVCHTLKDAESAGTIGPDLDSVRPTREAVKAMVKEGAGAMPAFGEMLDEASIDAVAAYVSHVTGGAQ